jgi:protein TonB
VIKADPPSVFNRAAIDAVKKWKYRPKVVDGKAVEEHNVKAHVVFNLNDP